MVIDDLTEFGLLGGGDILPSLIQVSRTERNVIAQFFSLLKRHLRRQTDFLSSP